MTAAATIPTAISAAAPMISMVDPLLKAPAKRRALLQNFGFWSDRAARVSLQERIAGKAILAAFSGAATWRVLGLVYMDQAARWCLPSALSPESKICVVCWCSLLARGPFVR